MAILASLNSDVSFYLRDFHRFGRLAHSVDTLLNYPEVTRIHAVIEWVEPHWYIRDLSKNGIWLNGKRLDKQINSPLALNDRLSFSEINNLDYQLTSIDPPRDLLLPINGTNTHCILLERYHFLPDSQHPTAVIFYDPDRLSWCYENTETHQLVTLEDGHQITIGEQLWQFFQRDPHALQRRNRHHDYLLSDFFVQSRVHESATYMYSNLNTALILLQIQFLLKPVFSPSL